MIGPVIGGFMLSRTGMAPSYALIVAVYVAATISTLGLHPPKRTPTGTTSSVIGNLVETARYIRKEEVVLALLLLAFLVNLTGFPLNNGLMPVFARDVLGTDASGLGILLGAYAVGGFLGSLTIAGIPQINRPGRVMIFGSIAWHVAILVISQMQWFTASIPVLALTGLSQSFAMVTMSMMLLGVTSPDIRGRVMGIRSLAVYGLPIGLLISGALADAFGVHTALIINAVVGILFTMLIAAWLRQLWHSGHTG
jgi:predicted MFS family arabinose efflux permease